MIDQLDESLRQHLIREIPIKNGEIDIAFDQPKREWSARLSRPTLNIFLHDVRENTKLRHIQWDQQPATHSSVKFQRTPARIDLHYLITAWANDPEDEHRLLTATLLALLRYDKFPDDLLSERLRAEQPVPIPIKVAQYDELRNPSELWSALDNELRAGLVCMITVAMNPYQPSEAPLVRTRELRIGVSERPQREQLNGHHAQEEFWSIGGQVKGNHPLDSLQVTLVDHNIDVPLQAEGRFVIGNLKAGTYTLQVSNQAGRSQQYEITVPSPDYELDLSDL